MDVPPINFVPLHVTSWEHAHELATVLRRAGLDAEYDPPRPGSNEGTIGFEPAAIYVPHEQADEARVLLAQWCAYSERRINELARKMWKGLLPIAISMVALALGMTALTGDFNTGLATSFCSFLFGGFCCSLRRRVRGLI